MATLSSPTLERIVRDIRVLLNQPRAENSRWSDTELGEYVNDGISRFFLHINEVAEGQFDKQTDLNLVGGTETVALPSDFFAIKVLYKKLSSQYKPLVYRNNFIEPYSSDSSTADASNYEPTYYLRANNLVLRPIPGNSETAGLRLEYTAFPETLITGGDTLTAGISPVFKELVVMYGVYKAKLKDDLVQGGNTRQGAEALLADLYNNFKHQVTERSKYPQYIVPWTP